MLRNRLHSNDTLFDWVRKIVARPNWRFLDAQHSVFLGELATGSGFDGRLTELIGRSVLVATNSQLAAAVALIELDGLARRLILCPSDFVPRHLPAIVTNAEVDAIVSDRAMSRHPTLGVDLSVTCLPKVWPTKLVPPRRHQTEWVLLTSGTTGAPKAIVHTLESLTAAIAPRRDAGPPVVWATFYDILRYGGLQIFLRAVLGGASFVLSDKTESIEQFLERLRTHAVTHVTGTPSHWRRVLWSAAARSIAPRYVRLSGEVADQAILDNLRANYPRAKIDHAYASTEAGVGFEVEDEREGFPISFLQESRNNVEMKIEGGTLRIRSAGTAVRYLGDDRGPVASADGFVDTGDMITLSNGRCYFVGRINGVINVGGLKVHPEEIEAVINRHPKVRVSLVRRKNSPITGAVVVADVVLAHTLDGEDVELRKSEVKDEILQLCRDQLEQYKVPVMISFVSSLAIAQSGKLRRNNA